MYGHNNFASPHCGNNVALIPPAFVDQSWQHLQNYDTQVKHNINNQLLLEALHKRKLDTDFLNNFIDENTEIPSNSERKIKLKRLGIAETKALISSINNLNSKLEEATKNLSNKKKSSPEEWQSNVDNCHDLKKKITKLLKNLSDNEKICSFKDLLRRRKNKRLRDKKMREKMKKIKLINKEKRARLNEKADAWIREKQEEINREKQNESLKKDADIILSDVRGKRSDARKYLGVLRELKNLRKVMASNARARGENLSSAADQSFENIIEQLSSHWAQLDREYSIEEQGLKLMLQTDNEKTIAKQKKNSFDDWESLIFGRRLPAPENVQKDLNRLVMTRFAWDKFISNDNESSRIPLGWIMPDPPTSASWQRCLKKY